MILVSNYSKFKGESWDNLGGGVEVDFVRGLRRQKDRETLLFLTLDAVKIGETKHLGVQIQMNFYKETAAALSMYQSMSASATMYRLSHITHIH
jgi:hypothetical protein